MSSQAATVSCSGASLISQGPTATPPPGGQIDHIIIFDFLGAGNIAWINCTEMKNHFLIETEELELDPALIQSAFIGIISLWAIGIGMGLIISLIRKLRS